MRQIAKAIIDAKQSVKTGPEKHLSPSLIWKNILQTGPQLNGISFNAHLSLEWSAHSIIIMEDFAKQLEISESLGKSSYFRCW